MMSLSLLAFFSRGARTNFVLPDDNFNLFLLNPNFAFLASPRTSHLPVRVALLVI
jgi:hypothetical protein